MHHELFALNEANLFARLLSSLQPLCYDITIQPLSHSLILQIKVTHFSF